jgi:hypothetical protein
MLPMSLDSFVTRVSGLYLAGPLAGCDLLVEEIGMCSGTHKRDLVALRPVNQ